MNLTCLQKSPGAMQRYWYVLPRGEEKLPRKTYQDLKDWLRKKEVSDKAQHHTKEVSCQPSICWVDTWPLAILERAIQWIMELEIRFSGLGYRWRNFTSQCRFYKNIWWQRILSTTDDQHSTLIDGVSTLAPPPCGRRVGCSGALTVLGRRGDVEGMNVCLPLAEE